RRPLRRLRLRMSDPGPERRLGEIQVLRNLMDRAISYLAEAHGLGPEGVRERTPLALLPLRGLFHGTLLAHCRASLGCPRNRGKPTTFLPAKAGGPNERNHQRVGLVPAHAETGT